MVDLIKEFKAKMASEGRTFKWFHGEYLENITYAYFIIQLHDNDRLHDSVKIAIKKFLEV